MISKNQIKYITSLQQKKYRAEYNSYVVEGKKIVDEAIHQTPNNIEYICYTSSNKKISGLSQIIDASKLLEISEKDFTIISSLTTPQGILAVLNKPVSENPANIYTTDIILALDSIRDPGNMGTIIRLCDWFGIQHIVCSEDTVECYNPKVVQASMGAILRINVYYTELLSWLTEIKKQKEIQIYGTTMNGKNLYSTQLKNPAVIVMGSEAHGLSDDIVNILDSNITIPNFSNNLEKTESLNVSVATAILCSEFRRNSLRK